MSLSLPLPLQQPPEPTHMLECPLQRHDRLAHVGSFGVVLQVGDSQVISPLLLADEAAAYLRTSRDSLYKLCQARRIPHTRVGDALRFDVRRLTQWLSDRERGKSAVRVIRHSRQA